MRSLLLTVLLILSFLPLIPSAGALPSCSFPDVYIGGPVVGSFVVGAAWYNSCIGAVAAVPGSSCTNNPINQGQVHVYFLVGYECETGIIIG